MELTIYYTKISVQIESLHTPKTICHIVTKMVAQDLCMYKSLRIIGWSRSQTLSTVQYMHTSMHRTGNETILGICHSLVYSLPMVHIMHHWILPISQMIHTLCLWLYLPYEGHTVCWCTSWLIESQGFASFLGWQGKVTRRQISGQDI